MSNLSEQITLEELGEIIIGVVWKRAESVADDTDTLAFLGVENQESKHIFPELLSIMNHVFALAVASNVKSPELADRIFKSVELSYETLFQEHFPMKSPSLARRFFVQRMSEYMDAYNKGHDNTFRTLAVAMATHLTGDAGTPTDTVVENFLKWWFDEYKVQRQTLANFLAETEIIP